MECVLSFDGGNMDLGLLVLRLAVGLTLAAHGTQKLFGWFGGGGIAGTGAGFEGLGFRPGKRAAFLAGLGEAGGGLLLALGAATPLAAAMALGVMTVAIFSVHIKKGFFNHNGGYEFPLVLASAALCLAIAGPGSYSVDAFLGLELHGPAWGIAALTLGIAAAGLQLASRHPAPAPQPTVQPKGA